MKASLVLVADHTHPLEALAPAVGTAAANGCERIAIDIAGLTGFDVSHVRALIALLRIAREGGASLALHVGSAERRRTLCDMGLDRVFAIPEHAAAS